MGARSPAHPCFLHLPAGERAGPEQAPPGAENNSETPAGAEVTPSGPRLSPCPRQLGPGQQAESQAWGGGCAPSEWGGRSAGDQPKGHRPSLEPCSAGCLQASHTPSLSARLPSRQGNGSHWITGLLRTKWEPSGHALFKFIHLKSKDQFLGACLAVTNHQVGSLRSEIRNSLPRSHESHFTCLVPLDSDFHPN